MTREEIAAMIGSFGVPTAFGQFGDDDGEGTKPQAAPFIFFSYTSRSDFYADGINYAKIVLLTIELVTASPDFDLQNAIEAALTQAEMIFDQPDQEYDDGQRVYITTYETSVILTESPPPPEPLPVPPVPDPSDPATLYEGQTVVDGWIVNEDGSEGVDILNYADDPQYQGVRFRLTLKVNGTIDSLNGTIATGQWPIYSVFSITIGPNTYVDGTTNVESVISIPDDGVGIRIWTRDGTGIKDIVLTRIDEQT